MKREISREYFAGLSNNLILGNWDVVLDQLQSPLVVFLDGRPSVFPTANHIHNAVMHYRDKLIRSSAQAVSVQEIKACNVAGERSCFLVSEAFWDWSSSHVGAVKARYFVNYSELGPRIEMIEYVENSFLDRSTILKLRTAA